VASFKVGNWPSGCWRPYSSTSPFNVKVPASPKLNPLSAQIVQRLLGFGPAAALGAGTADTTNDWGHPTYYSQSTDPLMTISGGTTDGPSAIDGKQIPVPAGARPARASDHHMTVVYGGWEYDFWDAAISGSTINVNSGARIRIDGDGLWSAATASRFGNLAGIIRAQEMEAGQIDHALFMAVDCTSGSYVWPAAKTDSQCTDPTNAPPMGAHFQLAMTDAQIDALSVPGWKKTILRAMAHYGMFVGDSTSSPWAFQFESGSTYTSFGYEDEMVKFAKSVGIVPWSGAHYFNIAGGVDWAHYLRVVDPCVAQQTC
jgi:hypothetical protein